MKNNRLIYKSIAYPETLEKEAITDLMSQSVSNNKAHGIYGLLLLSGNRFLQILEGPPKFINRLYKNIIIDERHHDVELLLYEDIGEPYFADWNMRLIELDQVSIPVYKMLLKKYPHEKGKLVFPKNKLLLYSLLQDALYFSNFTGDK